MTRKMEGRRYLGDGVYVRYDGDSIHMAVNHHLNEVVVLEPAVITALEQFVHQVRNQQIEPVKSHS